MQSPRLDEAFDAILDAVGERLQDQSGPDGLLDGVKDIVAGDRARGGAKAPAVWYFGDVARADARPSAPTFGLTETWTLPIVLIAVAFSNDPAQGQREAARLAARARSVLIVDRDLGLRRFVDGQSAGVIAVHSARFAPRANVEQQPPLYTAEAVVDVVFTVLEQ